MMINSKTQRQTAMTRIEWLAVAFVLILLIGLLPRHCHIGRARAQRLTCLSYLKQIGLAARMWRNDNGGNLPWQVPVATNGTLEFADSPEAHRHFLALSNYLLNPKVFACPSDTKKSRVEDLAEFNGAHLSYFIRLDLHEGQPQSILSGDRNLTTNGQPAVGLVTVAPNTLLGFTREMHRSAGNIALSDGSAQMVTEAQLRSGTKETFRLVIP